MVSAGRLARAAVPSNHKSGAQPGFNILQREVPARLACEYVENEQGWWDDERDKGGNIDRIMHEWTMCSFKEHGKEVGCAGRRLKDGWREVEKEQGVCAIAGIIRINFACALSETTLKINEQITK